MELMSLLLLCEILMLPQASVEGISSRKLLNHTKIHNKDASKNTKILLNTNNGLYMHGDFQPVFTDGSCRECSACMNRAIQAYNIQSNILNDILDDYSDKRNKRAANVSEIASNMDSKTKKIKTKKNKVHKSVIVTKYNLDGEVYALKVKETNTPLTPGENEKGVPVTTCLVYQVKKSFTCDSPEGDLILTVARRKVNKRSKKDKDKTKLTTTTETTVMTLPVFRKRHIDNSQVPENFMPSIEELY